MFNTATLPVTDNGTDHLYKFGMPIRSVGLLHDDSIQCCQTPFFSFRCTAILVGRLLPLPFLVDRQCLPRILRRTGPMRTHARDRRKFLVALRLHSYIHGASLAQLRAASRGCTARAPLRHPASWHQPPARARSVPEAHSPGTGARVCAIAWLRVPAAKAGLPPARHAPPQRRTAASAPSRRHPLTSAVDFLVGAFWCSHYKSGLGYNVVSWHENPLYYLRRNFVPRSGRHFVPKPRTSVSYD